MANTTDVAAETASELSEADLDRVREFSREPILLEGETIADLEPGTARRRAVDTALAELAEGREAPSFEWRRDYSLLLGLERLLWEPKPSLRDGAELKDHQVDALSGTLAAITAEVEGPEGEARRNGRGNGARGEANGEAANGEGEGGLDGEERPAGARRGAAGLGRGRDRARWSRRRPRTPARAVASGSSTRPAPARRSPRWASSRPRARAAC